MTSYVLEPIGVGTRLHSESAHKSNRKENEKEQSTHVVVVVIVLGQVADVAMAGHDGPVQAWVR